MFRAITVTFVALTLAASAFSLLAADPPGRIPPPAARTVSFAKDIRPLFEASCISCHAKGKEKGGFSLETHEAFMKGGDSGAAAVIGKSADSLIVKLVAGVDPDNVMPMKGTKWTAEQVALLRAWIDQGAQWDTAVSFAKAPALNLKPNPVPLPDGPEAHPVDRFLAVYAGEKNTSPLTTVSDELFARRVYLDTIGLLPTPEQLRAFLSDASPDKREKLVQKLLADNRGYAENWLTFWNDLLRNDYRGTGFIDGGRRQISGWLYSALYNNMPYDRFVAELVNPQSSAGRSSEGFSFGILWRGNVNASMLPPMQAAQNIAQVFMGVNLKCASCHDSFINDWTLADAYGLAAFYSDEPLELVHCDKPTGKFASMRLLYPELGTLGTNLSKDQRLAVLSQLFTSKNNGRLSRTIVNRLWARLLGRGLVEPIDDMEQPAWYPKLLDYLAEDLVAHNYDLKRTLFLILTSRAYQAPSVENPDPKAAYVFRGPLTRRLTAEQFYDTITGLTDEWPRMPATIEFDFSANGSAFDIRMPKWIWTDEDRNLGRERALEELKQRYATDKERRRRDEAARFAAEDAARDRGLSEGPNVDQGKPTTRPSMAEALAKRAAERAARHREVSDPFVWYPGSNEPAARHRVIFRKTITLDAVPVEANASAAASQSFAVHVNGKPAGRILSDGHRFGRVAVFDLKPHLVKGENTIALEVWSHSEKVGLGDEDYEVHVRSRNHENSRSGVAFHLAARMPGGELIEIVSNPSWRVRRAPEENWQAPNGNHEEWEHAVALAEGVTPVDEAQGMEPVRRKDWGNSPIELGPTIRPAIATAMQPGRIRAAMIAADPLMTALERPNREQVITQRLTAATTLQALELTNGATLDGRLRRRADRLAKDASKDPAAFVENLFQELLTRKPSDSERQLALDLLSPEGPEKKIKGEAMADLLWSLFMLPEFQLIN